MQNEGIKNNPKDHVVVSFRNTEEFGFTPEMGCMFDGRPINGVQGGPGINAGEEMTLPYHIGHRLATNLAKIATIRRAPTVDEANNPVGKPLWDDVALDRLKNSYIKELYTEQRPIAISETDRLMAKVEEYKAMVEKLIPPKPAETPAAPVATAPEAPAVAPAAPEVTPPPAPTAPEAPKAPTAFADKQDVIAELEKRQIKHDKRKSKADLEKLLA